MVAPSFEFSAIKTFADIFNDASVRMVSSWRARGDGAVVEVSEQFRSLTLEVIGMSTMSLSHDEVGAFADLYCAIMTELNKRIWWGVEGGGTDAEGILSGSTFPCPRRFSSSARWAS